MDSNRKHTKTGIMAMRSIAACGILASAFSVWLSLHPIFTGKFYAKRGVTENLKIEDPTAFWIFLSLHLAVTAYLVWLTGKIVIKVMKTYR